MTFPPLKSMYLLRGTLVTLLTFWVFCLLLLWPMSSRFSPAWWFEAQGFFIVSLVVGVLGGIAHTADMRNRDKVLALIVDDSLPDYERDTLRAIRAASPWAANLPTDCLRHAYSDWVNQTGYWENVPSSEMIRAFLAYAFARPIDRY